MDWTAARPAHLAKGGLAEELDEPVRDGRPHERVPQKPGGEMNVEPQGQSLGGRIHGYTLLVVVGIVQLAWLTTLGYALLRLFS